MADEKREPMESEELGAPLYMMSFGDMMTNLLCFFILLCAFADERQSGFISDGIGSIRRALMSHGLPGILEGDRLPVEIGESRVLFRPSRSISPKQLVERDGTISDANRDSLRQVVLEALTNPGTTELPVPIIFRRGSATLTESHRSALRELGPMLSGGNYEIRVEGYAWEEGLDHSEAWALSSRRAQNVLAYLSEVGDIPKQRLVPYGYGPAMGRREAGNPYGPSLRQERLGRRSVLLSLVRQ